MTSVTSHHDSAAVHHGPPRPPGGWRRLLYPGLVRAAWVTPIFIGIGFGIVVLCRWWGDWHPIWNGEIIVLVGSLTAAPLGFLVGLGGFDYWVYYASGAADRGRRITRVTAPQSWRDYFRVNTDHKVIGVQYVVTTIIFFCIGGLLAMLFRAELAQPGDQFFNPQTFNVPGLRPRGADDLPVRDPGLRRARQLRDPADARRAPTWRSRG